MRYRLTVPRAFGLPNNKALVGSFRNGAVAWKNGQPVTANPYEADRAPGYYKSWERGWKCAKVGLITVEEPGTRHRVYGKEVVRV